MANNIFKITQLISGRCSRGTQFNVLSTKVKSGFIILSYLLVVYLNKKRMGNICFLNTITYWEYREG